MSKKINAKLALTTALLTAINATAVAGEAGSALQEVPVSVLGAIDTNKLGISGVSDMLSGSVAGVQVQNANDNSSSLELIIRGFGGTTASQPTGESGVAVFVDGVYQSRAQSLGMDIVDLESVEVLRGPQGVLSGRNAIGGAVKFVSKKPSGELGFSQQFSLGSEYEEFKSISHLDLPQIAGILSAKISYLVNDHDGWVENQTQNSATNNNNYWLKENEGLRAALNFDLSDNLVVDYVYQDSTNGSTPPYFQSVIEGTTGVAVETGRADSTRSAINLPISETENETHSLTATWQINDTLALRSISSYGELDTTQFNNFDGVLGAGVGITGATADQQNQEQTTTELQLSGSLLDGGLEFIVGGSYFDEEVLISGDLNRGISETESFAIYAQGVYAINDRLDAVVGWRETSDEKNISSSLLSGAASGQFVEIEDDNTDYSVGFNYAVNDKVSTFARFSTGTKSAGASLFAEGLQPYEAETVSSLDIGWTGMAWNDRIDYSITLFTAEYKDKQVAFADPDNALQSYVINATEDSTHEGIELDASIQLAEGLVVTASYAFLDTDPSRLNIPVADDGFGGTEFVLGAGAATSIVAVRAPRHSGNVAVDYLLGEYEFGSISLYMNYNSTSPQYFDAASPNQDSRDIINASVTLGDIQLEGDSGSLEISLWGRNLNGEEYVTNSIQIPASQSMTRAYGEPRTYGVNVLYKY